VGEVIWLQPYPDMLLEGLADATPGPEARYEAAEAISLAFVTALQTLPPRQRAVLILRDVLGFPTSQVAGILDSSEDSAASALKRARAAMRDQFPPAPPGRYPRARAPPGNGTWSTGSPAPTRPATWPASSPCSPRTSP
jgi:RNA polymerase sigma-70 factor (ECF subfamily)